MKEEKAKDKKKSAIQSITLSLNNIENHQTAAKHHEKAAKHHLAAVRQHQSGNDKKAYKSTVKAQEHYELATVANREVSKQHALKK
jgi:hypothetical protein